MLFQGGFPHALRPLYGLLYVPLEFQISRHTVPALVLCSPHLPENSGTYLLAPFCLRQMVPSPPICWRNWMLCLDGKWRIILLRGALGAWGSLTCSKFTTRVKQLKVPPGGLVPRIFPSLKIRRPPPRHSSHEVGTLPLDYGARFYVILTVLTYSWNWAVLEEPPIVQPLKNFPAFYGTRRFNTVFTRALHWCLSWAISIQSTSSHHISLRFILILSTHLLLGLSSGFFPFGFPTNILYTFLYSPIRATCPAHLILLTNTNCVLSYFLIFS
jgi:hypothetical protein